MAHKQDQFLGWGLCNPNLAQPLKRSLAYCRCDIARVKFLVQVAHKIRRQPRQRLFFEEEQSFALCKHIAQLQTDIRIVVGLDYLLDEARLGGGGKMMSVGIHSRWSGQAGRASAVRDFIKYALAQDGVHFMRRIDIAEHWIKAYPHGQAS